MIFGNRHVSSSLEITAVAGTGLSNKGFNNCTNKTIISKVTKCSYKSIDHFEHPKKMNDSEQHLHSYPWIFHRDKLIRVCINTNNKQN